MKTILVADDEFAVLTVLALSLEHVGYRVLRAGDGADALRLLVHDVCDLVLCDERMPVMNGWQLVEAMRIHPRLARIPVVMMRDSHAGPTEHEDPRTVLYRKPVLLDELLELIARVTGGDTSPRGS